MYRITTTTESRAVAETVLDQLDSINLTPEPHRVTEWDYTPADDTLAERVHDALRADGRKALADEYADANGASR